MMKLGKWRFGSAAALVTVLGLLSFLSGASRAGAREGLGLVVQSQPDCTAIVKPDEPIQKAIDTAKEGAVICLANGTWEEHIKITKNLTLRGTSSKPDDVRVVGWRPGFPAVWIEGEIVITLENLTLKARGEHCARDPICPDGLLVRGKAQVVINRLQISDNSKYSGLCGLRVSDSVSVSLTNSTISGNQLGLKVEDSATVSLTNSTVSGNGWVGLEVRDSATVSLADSTIQEGHWAGLEVRDSATVSLTNSTVSGHAAHGLYVDGSANVNLTNSIVSDNTIGLFVGGSARVNLTNSAISGEGYGAGLFLYELAQVSLTSSTISDNDDGLYVSGSARVSLTNTVISNNRVYGIKIGDSAQVQLSNSTITQNWDSGLFAWGSSRVILSDSVISDNGVDGLDVKDSATVEIYNNAIKENSWCGIFVLSKESQLRGTSNQMEGNGADLCGFAPASLRKPLVPQTERTLLSVPQDFTSLQEAVDAIAPGGTISVQSGSYTEGLTIWKPLVLQGQEKRETILQPKRSLGISVTAEAQGVSLRGLTVTGGNGSGIWVYGQVVLENIGIYNNGWDGLYVGGLGKVTLENVQISSNFNRGIVIGDQSTAQIQGSRIAANWMGIAMWDSAQLILQNSEIIGNEYGIVFSDYSGSAEISYNKILRNEAQGISLLGEDCGTGEAQAFRGSISGRDNEIELLYNGYGGLCPPYPGQPWPTGFVKNITTQVPIEPNVLDHAMAKDVMQSSPYDPIERTNTFSTEDEKAVSWIRLGRLYEAHIVTWKWYQPDGELYGSRRWETPDPRDQGYDWWERVTGWCWTYIKGFKPATMPGQWRVEVLFDGVPLLTETFIIKAPKGFVTSQRRTLDSDSALRLQDLQTGDLGYPIAGIISGGQGK